MKNKLISHVVAGYPNPKSCIDLLLGMQEAGVSAIEVQFPFSDPIADGSVIMEANDKALEYDMTVKASFKLIEAARKEGLQTPIYIVTYANKLLSFGYQDFVRNAKECNVRGLIIPDMPFDTKDFKDLKTIAHHFDLELICVISPGITTVRLNSYLSVTSGLIYLTSSRGITGNKLKFSRELHSLAGLIKKQTDRKLAIGFGVSSLDDVEDILKFADIAVVGSSVLDRVKNGGINEALQFVRKLIDE